MALYDPARHETLTTRAWSESDARALIDRIVVDTHDAFTEDGLWPIHPLDASPERAPVPTPLYYGAAGVIWAMHRLHEVAMVDLPRSYASALPRVLAMQRADALRLYGKRQRGFLLGEAGILLLQMRITPRPEIERELQQTIAAHFDEPECGVAWGVAGSLHAVMHMYERTHAPVWRDLYLRGFETLWNRWEYDPQLDCHLWCDELYGYRDRQLGALHGFAGIVHAMWRGRALLDRTVCAQLVERACKTFQVTARREPPLSNWPLVAGATQRPGAEVLRLQHCAGAPGIINALAALPIDPPFDRVLVPSGDLIWEAGPLAKPPSLCHGVPGSGYAFLKLYARTQEDHWLDRARSFAMHAIEQSERFVHAHGRRKFSLWTGDLGLAVYLADCMNAKHAMPLVDVFF